MAFPFIFQDSFESGATGAWTSETDTAAQLDVTHYSALARYDWPGAVPYDGAYAMRTVLSGGTADAFVKENALNIAVGGNTFFSIPIWISPDFTATADDTINIFESQDTGNVIEATFGLRVVATSGVINFGIGEVVPTSWSPLDIERGVWYIIDLDITIDSGAGNDGTIDMYITKSGSPAQETVSATQVASLDQGAITHGVLGVQNQLATTTGTILFGGLTQDDARVFPRTRRYDDTFLLTQSGHAFIGHGQIDNVTLLSGAGTDNVLKVYDTDVANTNDPASVVIELSNTANNETVDPAGVPANIVRGCYVELTGTNPRALLKTCKTVAFSDATVRNYGIRRT